MQCVILAGGMGTKMQSITGTLPKSLIPIRNKPFLHYQLSHLTKQGIQNVLLCIGYGGDQIERYAEDGRAWDLTIQYVKEDAELLGTGGALRLAYEQGRLEPAFFVLFGDSFFPVDFPPAWRYFETRTEPAAVVLYKNSERPKEGYVLLDGQKVTRYDQKHPTAETPYSDGGLSILRPAAIEEGIPPRSVYDLKDLFHKLSERRKLAGFEVFTRFYRIGSPEGFQDFADYLSKSSL